jgi:hypothetical protein
MSCGNTTCRNNDIAIGAYQNVRKSLICNGILCRAALHWGYEARGQQVSTCPQGAQLDNKINRLEGLGLIGAWGSHASCRRTVRKARWFDVWPRRRAPVWAEAGKDRYTWQAEQPLAPSSLPTMLPSYLRTSLLQSRAVHCARRGWSRDIASRAWLFHVRRSPGHIRCFAVRGRQAAGGTRGFNNGPVPQSRTGKKDSRQICARPFFRLREERRRTQTGCGAR